MKVIQFGTGRFLRGFFSPLIAAHPQFQPRSICAVQSRLASEGADQINSQADGFHVWVRGIEEGNLIDRAFRYDTLGMALHAQTDWLELCQRALDPETTMIVSNTTEQGLTLDQADQDILDTQSSPRSFPAKVAILMFLRFRAGLPGITLLPLELVDQNGSTLRGLVEQQVANWPWLSDPKFLDWLKRENRWLNNLVDRIVVRVSDTPPWTSSDALAVVCEPYHLLAIADDGGRRDILPDHPAIQWVDDLKPLFERKVRILNGLHTAMVQHSLPRQFQTVLEVINHPQERKWLEQLLENEILPVLRVRIPDVDRYAATVWERLSNPFFVHRLSDIALNHASKIQTRLEPTRREYQQQFGRSPELLEQLCHQSS